MARALRSPSSHSDAGVRSNRSPTNRSGHGRRRECSQVFRVEEIFDRHRTSVDVVATSEISVSLTIDDARHLDSLVVDLSQLGDVSVERNRGIVALVGAGLGADSQAMARALGALKDMRVHMLSLSASGINLTMLVDADQVPSAMRQLHAAFFASGAPVS